MKTLIVAIALTLTATGANAQVVTCKHGRAISGRKWAGLITSSKGGVVCALA